MNNVTERTELKKWAENEVKLYNEENDNIFAEENANLTLKIYNELIDNCISESDICIIYDLLGQLISGQPLTSIEDIPEIWTEGSIDDLYVCKRYPSLYKKVVRKDEENEHTLYIDANRFVCIDINDDNLTKYHDTFVESIVNDIYPIEFPYQPLGRIIIFIEKFKYYENSESYDAMAITYDTIAITYIKLPNGDMKDVGKYFKFNLKNDEIEEIRKTEYFARKKRYEDKEKGEEK